MSHQIFDYEDDCMGARNERPASYFRSFGDDHRIRSLTRSLSLLKGRILDIGCGGGMISETLPYYYPHASIYGCDVSHTAISYAKRYGSGAIHYRSMKKRFPFADHFFDACICLDVLEHVPDVDYFLREVRRVLKKGGKFFLIVPCEGERGTYTWVFQQLHIGEKRTFEYFGHIHPEFTHEYVQNLLIKHGFAIQQKEYSEHMFYQWMHVFIFFLPKFFLEWSMGKKNAHRYSDSGLIREQGTNPFILMIRRVWYTVFDVCMRYPMNWETIFFRRVPFAAWKLHITATV